MIGSENLKTDKSFNAPHNSIRTPQADSQRQGSDLVEGVSILGFMLGSAAKRAGLKERDVIIEYDGTKNLSAEKLASLARSTMAKECRPRVVFLRDGREHSLRLSAGPLGISAAEAAVQRPLSDPHAAATSRMKNVFRSLVNPEIVLRTLRNTDRPVAGYVWRAWLILLIPVVPMGIIASALGIPGPDIPSLDRMGSFAVAAILIAPWAETLLMLPILWILKRFIRSTLWVAFASAVVWGMLHALNAIGHGLTATWMFLVLSVCFLEWEKKSKATAIGVTSLLHMCQNSLAMAALFLSLVLGAEFPEEKVAAPPAPRQTKEAPARPMTQKFQFGLAEPPRPQADDPGSGNNLASARKQILARSEGEILSAAQQLKPRNGH